MNYIIVVLSLIGNPNQAAIKSDTVKALQSLPYGEPTSVEVCIKGEANCDSVVVDSPRWTYENLTPAKAQKHLSKAARIAARAAEQNKRKASHPMLAKNLRSVEHSLTNALADQGHVQVHTDTQFAKRGDSETYIEVKLDNTSVTSMQDAGRSYP